jgi:hypothetical protein
MPHGSVPRSRADVHISDSRNVDKILQMLKKSSKCRQNSPNVEKIIKMSTKSSKYRQNHQNVDKIIKMLTKSSKCRQNHQNVDKIFQMSTKSFKCPGWSDWANSRLLDDCLLWHFLKIAEVAHIFFPRLTFCINFDNNWIGLHVGWFFHNLILSPWKCRQKMPTFLTPFYITTSSAILSGLPM